MFINSIVPGRRGRGMKSNTSRFGFNYFSR